MQYLSAGPTKMLSYAITPDIKVTHMDVDMQVLKPNFTKKDVEINGEPSKADATKRQRALHSVQQFSYERIRQCTFDDWPTSFIDKTKLAQSGFICMKSNDLTQCYFCKGIVGFWEKGDDPIKEHKRHFPNCPLMQGLETSNIPCVEEKNSLFPFLEKYLQFSLEHQKPSVPKMKYQTDTAVVNPSSAAYISYSSFESRFQSFKAWPLSTKLPKAELIAKAGFFYSGTSDFVICFYCGGGLFNWSSSDDPMADHITYYEFCSFIRMETKTPNSTLHKYHRSTESNESSISSFRPKKLSSDEENLLLNYSFSKRLLLMGLTPNSVKKSLSEFLQTYSYLPGTLMNCIEVIIDWEDKKSEVISVDESKIKSTLRESSEVSECGSSDADRKIMLVEEVSTLKEAINCAKKLNKCRKCAERAVEVLFLPCNHFHLCRPCSSNCEKCPACDAKIIGTIFPIVSNQVL